MLPSTVIPPRPLNPETGTLNATCTMALSPLTATKLVLFYHFFCKILSSIVITVFFRVIERHKKYAAVK